MSLMLAVEIVHAPLVSISEMTCAKIVSIAEQAGLCMTWSETQQTGFHTTRLKGKVVSCVRQLSLHLKTRLLFP